MGTPGYSAPEQFSGLPAGKEADVHAIGALIAECYSGGMPGCWKYIHLKATTSSPKSRYQTVHELCRAVNMRHWRKVIASALAVTLIGFITLKLVKSYQEHSAVERMPHRFYEKGFW